MCAKDSKLKRRRSKKQHQLQRLHDVAAEKEGAIRTALKSLGILERLRGTGLKEYLVNRVVLPRIQIDLSAEESNIHTRQIRKELLIELERSTFDSRCLGEGFPAAKFLNVVLPIAGMMKNLISSDWEMARRLDGEKNLINAVLSCETVDRAGNALFNDLRWILMEHGRIDRQLYFLSMEELYTARNLWYLRFGLHETPPERQIAKLEGKARPVFRCGQPFSPGGIEWLSWTSTLLQIPGDERHYPVFVQSHALERLYGRLSRLGPARPDESVLHAHLWLSLREPVFVPSARMPPGHWLVEYRAAGLRLGYLVAALCENKIVIKTFLFLTMDGTPEGDALYRKLRLARRDKEYFGLNSLQGFVESDLSTDSDLQEIFTECGCQDLFECGELNPATNQSSAIAEDLRSFLSRVRVDKNRTGVLPTTQFNVERSK